MRGCFIRVLAGLQYLLHRACPIRRMHINILFFPGKMIDARLCNCPDRLVSLRLEELAAICADAYGQMKRVFSGQVYRSGQNMVDLGEVSSVNHMLDSGKFSELVAEAGLKMPGYGLPEELWHSQGLPFRTELRVTTEQDRRHLVKMYLTYRPKTFLIEMATDDPIYAASHELKIARL